MRKRQMLKNFHKMAMKRKLAILATITFIVVICILASLFLGASSHAAKIGVVLERYSSASSTKGVTLQLGNGGDLVPYPRTRSHFSSGAEGFCADAEDDWKLLSREFGLNAERESPVYFAEFTRNSVIRRFIAVYPIIGEENADAVISLQPYAFDQSIADGSVKMLAGTPLMIHVPASVSFFIFQNPKTSSIGLPRTLVGVFDGTHECFDIVFDDKKLIVWPRTSPVRWVNLNNRSLPVIDIAEGFERGRITH